jgi:hypothetical protein
MREWQSLSHARWYCRLCFSEHNLHSALVVAPTSDGGLSRRARSSIGRRMTARLGALLVLVSKAHQVGAR